MSCYLGINYDGCHDSNVAYYSNEIECALNEERFSGRKHDGRPPIKALRHLYKNYTLKQPLVAYAGLPESVSRSIWEREGLERVYPIVHSVQQRALRFLRTIATNPYFVSHQASHAASAYFTSGFDQPSLVVVIDAGNYYDPYCVSVFEGARDRLNEIWRSTDHSIAQSYLVTTAALGFRPMLEEGKITGLAAYGQKRPELVEKLAAFFDDKEYVFRATKWRYLCHPTIPAQLVITEEISVLRRLVAPYPREDVASALQSLTERSVLDLLSRFRADYEYLCLAGGVFANVKLNQAIASSGWQSVFVHPAMGDEGLSLGAALYTKAKLEHGLRPFRLENAALGATSAPCDIYKVCKQHNLLLETHKCIDTVVCDLLRSGHTVVRFDGRMEYGPRALGNRSVLCNADSPMQSKRLNAILCRTEFMPFAPVVCDYQARALFTAPHGTLYAASFMTVTFECTSVMKRIAPGAVHVDGTARPQILSKRFNASFYKLVDMYCRCTRGQSILINTSFNIHGQPIVLNLADCIATFGRSLLDALVVDNTLIMRS